MAITRDDFQNIPSSGIIPADMTPASEFAVSYFFSYTAVPNPSSLDASFRTKLVLHVLDRNDAIKYVITIEEQYFVLIAGGSGLVLYSWNWVSPSEKITGTIGEGPDAPPMTLGQGTFGVEPEEGSGTSDNEVIVESRFYSGIFTEPLEPGDKLKIAFHNAGAGYVVARASLQLATEQSVPLGQALRDPRVGTTWWFYVKDGKTRCALTRNDKGFRQRSDDAQVYALAATYFRAFRTGTTLYTVVQSNESINIIESRDEGVNWVATFDLEENIKILATQYFDGCIYIYAEATATIVSNDPKNPARNVEQGDLVRLVVRLKGELWEVAELGVIDGDDLPTKDIIGFECEKRTLYMMTNSDDRLRIFRSTDELKTLEALPSGE